MGELMAAAGASAGTVGAETAAWAGAAVFLVLMPALGWMVRAVAMAPVEETRDG